MAFRSGGFRSFSSSRSFSTSSGRSYAIKSPKVSSPAKAYKSYPKPTYGGGYAKDSFGRDIVQGAAVGAATGIGAGVGMGVVNNLMNPTPQVVYSGVAPQVANQPLQTYTQQPAQTYQQVPYQDNSWSFSSVLLTITILSVGGWLIFKKLGDKI